MEAIIRSLRQHQTALIRLQGEYAQKCRDCQRDCSRTDQCEAFELIETLGDTILAIGEAM